VASFCDCVIGQLELLPLEEAVPNPHAHVAIVACRRTPRGGVPVAWQGSAMLQGLAVADLLAVICGGGVRPLELTETLSLPWWERREARPVSGWSVAVGS
jgi:hypothetical protein